MSSVVQRRWLLVVVLLVQVMVALDMSVVNVALPHIKTALGFAPGALTWVVNAYALTFGGLMMLGGRIGDVAGRRRTLLAGLAVFGLASLGGGLARDPGQLIAARAVQGVGAAALTPVAFALITVYFPAGPARSRALVATRTVGRIGPRTLLVVGGVVASAGLGWFGLAMGPHGSFLISILGPSMVVSIGLGLCLVPAGFAATIGVPADEAGMASGLITSSRQVGGSIGLAILATVAVTVTRDSRAASHVAALASGYADAVGVAGGMLALAALAAFVLLPARRRASADLAVRREDSRMTGVRR